MDSNDKHQVTKNRHLLQAMGHAFDGIVAMLRDERNMRFHVLAAVLAVMVGWWLKISTEDWLWILLVIFLVLAAEFLNTVTEAITDLLVGHHYDINVKKAKDVAAGGVLLAALFAVAVGAIIFVPRLLVLIR
ncbi:diacylglycerol kinase family protein [Limosilactobacillus sp.]|jgi:undecaprenol kinase|uniref:diacylglycerol kinase family protein n=1 Tax=Limosilactobacillus sp. TaxID=2773925 RepID=UPI0025BDA29B|nr:diacylglycerol kinase family protein [Limosilactobacillus sp.]MCH3922672.1 diacylglycerol kinase family protein [Limosilactobacillus sp.]MCH3927355.1 diacylglycerol kinase family protein [Limosilactobacillus sp.]